MLLRDTKYYVIHNTRQLSSVCQKFSSSTTGTRLGQYVQGRTLTQFLEGFRPPETTLLFLDAVCGKWQIFLEFPRGTNVSIMTLIVVSWTNINLKNCIRVFLFIFFTVVIKSIYNNNRTPLPNHLLGIFQCTLYHTLPPTLPRLPHISNLSIEIKPLKMPELVKQLLWK